MDFYPAPDIHTALERIVTALQLVHISTDHLYCFRSRGTTSRAIARIWSLPRIWQLALSLPASYCIEVISERFDKLSVVEKDKVLIHELMHIPKNFSGALLPHKTRYSRIDSRSVDKLFQKLLLNG